MQNLSVVRRVLNVTSIMAAGALPFVMMIAAGAVTTVGVTRSSGPSGWESLWLSGTHPSSYTTTLAQIRSMIGADTGPAATLTGKGVGIALIDTGVAPVAGLPASQVVNGPDLSFESQAPDLRYLDGYGHGTHLAGIIVGNDSASGLKGLAPDAKLTSIKVGTANGAVDVTQMIAAIDWVVAHRYDDPAYPIRVLNLSYGSGGNPNAWTDPLQFAVEQAWKANIVVVAAAGNQGSDSKKLTNPANDQWVLAVGSVTTNGTVSVADDLVAPYANFDETRLPDVLAPGDSVASLRVPGSNIDNMYPGARVGEKDKEALFKGTGTSQAAAITSAAAALLVQFLPWFTASQVKQYLIDGRVWLPNGSRGMGEVNVNSAIAKFRERPTAACQSWPWGKGDGQIELARGSSHVMSEGTALQGENSIFGPFDAAQWSSRSAEHTSWSGGSWMGHPVAGSGWNGMSWASRTWGSEAWSGRPWAGAETWNDPGWIGRYWSGKQWTPGDWIGRYWSNDTWSASSWG